MSRLDDIFNPIFAYGVDWTENRDKSPEDHDVSVFAGKIKGEFSLTVKQQIKELFLELIGEDEMPGAGRMIGVPQVQRDNFRAELRKKVKEL